MLKRNSVIVHSFGGCQKWEPACRIGEFENFFNDFAKSPRVLPSSWIFYDWNFYCKNLKILHSIWGLYDKNNASKYCFTSDVMFKKYKRLVYTPPDLLASKLVEHKKFDLICFPRICFLGLIYCDQEPLCLLNVIEDYCYFLCVHIRLSTRWKILFTLGLFANCFSLKSLSLSLKSHMNML